MKQLIGEEYEYYLDEYLISILEDNKDLQNIYIYSFIHYLSQPKNLLKDMLLYSKMVSLLFKLQSNAQLSELYRVILHQFTFQETSPDYFDLKAFVEYKLEMNEKAVKTLLEAHKLSFEKYNTVFESKFDSFRKFDQQNSKLESFTK